MHTYIHTNKHAYIHTPTGTHQTPVFASKNIRHTSIRDTLRDTPDASVCIQEHQGGRAGRLRFCCHPRPCVLLHLCCSYNVGINWSLATGHWPLVTARSPSARMNTQEHQAHAGTSRTLATSHRKIAVRVDEHAPVGVLLFLRELPLLPGDALSGRRCAAPRPSVDLN